VILDESEAELSRRQPRDQFAVEADAERDRRLDAARELDRRQPRDQFEVEADAERDRRLDAAREVTRRQPDQRALARRVAEQEGQTAAEARRMVAVRDPTRDPSLSREERVERGLRRAEPDAIGEAPVIGDATDAVIDAAGDVVARAEATERRDLADDAVQGEETIGNIGDAVSSGIETIANQPNYYQDAIAYTPPSDRDPDSTAEESAFRGGLQGALELANVPGLASSAAEGVEAGVFLARSDSPAQFRRRADVVAGQAAILATDVGSAAASNPARVSGQLAGSLVGSAGAIRGATRLGGTRAGRAAAVAIQPGEEALKGAGRAARSTAASRSLPSVSSPGGSLRSAVSRRTPDVDVRVDPDAPVLEIDDDLRRTIRDRVTPSTPSRESAALSLRAARARAGESIRNVRGVRERVDNPLTGERRQRLALEAAAARARLGETVTNPPRPDRALRERVPAGSAGDLADRIGAARADLERVLSSDASVRDQVAERFSGERRQRLALEAAAARARLGEAVSNPPRPSGVSNPIPENSAERLALEIASRRASFAEAVADRTPGRPSIDVENPFTGERRQRLALEAAAARARLGEAVSNPPRPSGVSNPIPENVGERLALGVATRRAALGEALTTDADSSLLPSSPLGDDRRLLRPGDLTISVGRSEAEPDTDADTESDTGADDGSETTTDEGPAFDSDADDGGNDVVELTPAAVASSDGETTVSLETDATDARRAELDDVDVDRDVEPDDPSAFEIATPGSEETTPELTVDGEGSLADAEPTIGEVPVDAGLLVGTDGPATVDVNPVETTLAGAFRGLDTGPDTDDVTAPDVRVTVPTDEAATEEPVVSIEGTAAAVDNDLLVDRLSELALDTEVDVAAEGAFETDPRPESAVEPETDLDQDRSTSSPLASLGSIFNTEFSNPVLSASEVAGDVDLGDAVGGATEIDLDLDLEVDVP
jgi:hypothetical protein